MLQGCVQEALTLRRQCLSTKRIHECRKCLRGAFSTFCRTRVIRHDANVRWDLLGQVMGCNNEWDTWRPEHKAVNCREFASLPLFKPILHLEQGLQEACWQQLHPYFG